jgi:hypothetical protein
MSFDLRLAFALLTTLALSPLSALAAEKQWIDYDGTKPQHIVLVSGDEEYRSEEVLPQLAKILARHHGFRSTVLFAVDPETGEINPNQRDNIPGLENLDKADLMVMFLRFRNLPDEQMKHIVDYVESGRPIVGIRTSTHAFDIKQGAYMKYGWKSKDWDGGFGRQVLGETWISHHGQHGKQSQRGIIAPGAKDHPILRGIHDGDIWGPSDVYGVKLPLVEGAMPLVLGQVLENMSPGDKPVDGKQNDPMMPIAWVRDYKPSPDKSARIFTTTMGCAQDMESAGYRRLLVNACYWGLGLDDQIPAESNVELVGKFDAHPFKSNAFTPGVKPADLSDR